MNLELEKRKVDSYSDLLGKILSKIDKFLELYRQMKSNKDIIVDGLKDDFISYFEENEFDIKRDSSGYNSGYLEYKKIIATYKLMKFELNTTEELYSDPRVSIWFYGEDNKNRYFEISNTTKEYNLIMDNKKVFDMSNIIKLEEDLQKNIKSLDYLEKLSETFSKEINDISEVLDSMNKYHFVATEKDNGKDISIIEFETIKEFIEKI